MKLSDLPDGATFLTGAGLRIRVERDDHHRLIRAVRVDPNDPNVGLAGWWYPNGDVRRDPGRHADDWRPFDAPSRAVFDPERIPDGGTVWGEGSRSVRTVRAHRLVSFDGEGLGLFVSGADVSRHEGRHRGGDDTRPGATPYAHKLLAWDGSDDDGTVLTAADLGGPIATYDNIVSDATSVTATIKHVDPGFARMLFGGDAPPPFSRLMAKIDGKSTCLGVLVPEELVRALRDDLRAVSFVKFVDRAPVEGSADATLDEWPAARELIVRAKGL